MDISKFSATFIAFMVLAMSHSSLSQNFPNDFLDAHNKARAQVGVSLPPLTWNNTVAAYAQNYATTMLAACKLQHSSGPYGENLALGYGQFSGVDAVNMWVNEKSNYDYASNSCNGGQCLHYTQVVWRNTQQIGCARLQCQNGEAWFVTCNYYPPGNYNGEKPY